jgi:hypothetical protein
MALITVRGPGRPGKMATSVLTPERGRTPPVRGGEISVNEVWEGFKACLGAVAWK